MKVTRRQLRKLIKESLYDSMERDLTLPSGKVLPNFRAMVIYLTSNIENAKQAYAIMEMIEEYSVMKDDKIKGINNKITKVPGGISMVSLFFTDKEVADAFYEAISNHPKAQLGPGPNLDGKIELFPVFTWGLRPRLSELQFYLIEPRGKL